VNELSTISLVAVKSNYLPLHRLLQSVSLPLLSFSVYKNEVREIYRCTLHHSVRVYEGHEAEFIHLVVHLTTGPKLLPKRALHIMRSRASSFRCQYPLLPLR
jgi:hypothetical protein